LTNSDTPRIPASGSRARVDLPAPFGPPRITTAGHASNLSGPRRTSPAGDDALDRLDPGRAVDWLSRGGEHVAIRSPRTMRPGCFATPARSRARLPTASSPPSRRQRRDDHEGGKPPGHEEVPSSWRALGARVTKNRTRDHHRSGRWPLPQLLGCQGEGMTVIPFGARAVNVHFRITARGPPPAAGARSPSSTSSTSSSCTARPPATIAACSSGSHTAATRPRSITSL
jgi:hypothetical protein